MQHHMIFLKDQKTEVMTPLFDACASWWTQGPDAKMQVIFIIVFEYLILIFKISMFVLTV
jgi:uncharacterized Rmd1/YagE family protein